MHNISIYLSFMSIWPSIHIIWLSLSDWASVRPFVSVVCLCLWLLCYVPATCLSFRPYVCLYICVSVFQSLINYVSIYLCNYVYIYKSINLYPSIYLYSKLSGGCDRGADHKLPATLSIYPVNLYIFLSFYISIWVYLYIYLSREREPELPVGCDGGVNDELPAAPRLGPPPHSLLHQQKKKGNYFLKIFHLSYYWKCDSPMSPHVRLMDGWSVMYMYIFIHIFPNLSLYPQFLISRWRTPVATPPTPSRAGARSKRLSWRIPLPTTATYTAQLTTAGAPSAAGVTSNWLSTKWTTFSIRIHNSC